MIFGRDGGNFNDTLNDVCGLEEVLAEGFFWLTVLVVVLGHCLGWVDGREIFISLMRSVLPLRIEKVARGRSSSLARKRISSSFAFPFSGTALRRIL